MNRHELRDFVIDDSQFYVFYPMDILVYKNMHKYEFSIIYSCVGHGLYFKKKINIFDFYKNKSVEMYRNKQFNTNDISPSNLGHSLKGLMQKIDYDNTVKFFFNNRTKLWEKYILKLFSLLNLIDDIDYIYYDLHRLDCYKLYDFIVYSNKFDLVYNGVI